MNALKSSTACLASVAIVALAACSSHTPNGTRTGAYNLDELRVDATVEANDYNRSIGLPTTTRATLILAEHGSANPNSLIIGEGDAVFLVGGNLRQPVDSESVAVPPSVGESDLRFVLARDGREHVIPLPLPPPFALLAPSEIRVGDKVTIDFEPRPALSANTKISLTILGSTTPLIVVPELPWIWDTSTLRSLPKQAGEDDATERPQFTIRVVTEIETKIEPFGQGTFAILSKITARRTGTSSDIVIRP